MSALFTNEAYSFISTPIDDVSTTINVTSGTGSRFPTLDGSDVNTFVWLTIQDASGAFEIVKMTRRAGDTLTVARGEQGSTAASWGTDARIEGRLTQSFLESLPQELPDGTMDRAINMGGQKITNLPEAIDDADPVVKAQLDAMNVRVSELENTDAQSWTITTASQNPNPDNLVLNPVPPITSADLVDGLTLRMYVPATNTGPMTINVSSLGVLPIVRNPHVPLIAGDMVISQMTVLTYRTSPTAGWLYTNATKRDVYEVGDVVFTTSSTNPATRYGYGVWARIAQGRFIVGEGAGAAGGESRTYPYGPDTVGRYTVTLTESQMPKHGHSTRVSTVLENTFRSKGKGGFPLTDASDGNYEAHLGTPSETAGEQVGGAGGGKSHENAPPAFGLYIWQRTA